MRLIVAATIAGLAAACPNACSGNGICGANNKCSCFQNWQGADCSLRTCSFTLAWADTADGTNQAHYYAECGNKGSCDRKTGDCVCFDGYEGKGCRRSTCPESCSGHGTCEYMEELGGDYQDRRNGPGASFKGKSCTNQLETSCSEAELTTTNVVARTANTDNAHGHNYQLWDAGKIQGCKCDLGYNGPDCSSREVPRGDDPMTTAKSETMKQFVQISPAVVVNTDDAPTSQFFLEYHDPYGGSWVTDSIDMVYKAGTSNWEPDETANAIKVQRKLRLLPNGVLSDVEVELVGSDQTVCKRELDGVQHISSGDETTDGKYRNSKGVKNQCSSSTLAIDDATLDLQVTFGNKPGQTGVQYLLDVHAQAQGAGHYPISTGTSEAVDAVVTEIVSDLDAVSELSTCSDRGLDNGEGECECFDGFSGSACEVQGSLS